MRGSDNVKLLDIGVIATWLLEQPWTFCDGDGIEEFDAIEAAKSLIQAQTDAGLGTFVLSELHAFIDGIKTSIRNGEPKPTLAPARGRVWKYVSPNGDAVLVRHQGEWQATPVVDDPEWNYWKATADDSVWVEDKTIPSWPGRFEVVQA